MQTRCERHGQVEIGIIEHEGREFSALGATVVGCQITGYTNQRYGDLVLTTWCGKTMLSTRCEVVERFWSGSLALFFRLTGQRFIFGYALGDSGMLFRGELLTDCSDEDAREAARSLSDFWAERDAEDEVDE